MTGVSLLAEHVTLHELVDMVITTLDARDPYTCAHSFRVAKYAEVIANHMKLDGIHRENVHIAAHLHDIGKIGVSDRILNKPGRLSAEEIKEMQWHPTIGFTILKRLPLFENIARIVLHHHERFDGCGYPQGLKGKEIPLESRIISVADAFDAMTSFRPYRNGIPADAAIREINSHSGDQFDPVVVGHFNAVSDHIVDRTRMHPPTTGDLSNPEHEYLMHSRAWVNTDGYSNG